MSRDEKINVICDIFNYDYSEVTNWSDENINNAYLSALRETERYN